MSSLVLRFLPYRVIRGYTVCNLAFPGHTHLLAAIKLLTNLKQLHDDLFFLSGLEVIKLEWSLRLIIKRNDWLLADMCPQAANHCDFLVE